MGIQHHPRNRLLRNQPTHKNKIYAQVRIQCCVDTSAKSFQPALKTSESAAGWLRILTADLASRLGEDEDHRLPRTVVIHYRHGGTTKSRQAALPMAKDMDKGFLYLHALNLWRGIEAYPTNNISVGLSGFGDVEEGVQGIQGFLVRGQQNQAQWQDRNEILGKRKRDDPGIARFFSKKDDASPEEPDFGEQSGFVPSDMEGDTAETYTCAQCQKAIPIPEIEVHEDYHVALELSRVSPIRPAPTTQGTGKVMAKEEKKGPKRKEKAVEKGQRRLEFGL